jgi:hypothetical protein
MKEYPYGQAISSTLTIAFILKANYLCVKGRSSGSSHSIYLPSIKSKWFQKNRTAAKTYSFRKSSGIAPDSLLSFRKISKTP